MIAQIVRLQKELALMLDSPCMDGDNIVEKFTELLNKTSPFEIVLLETRWVVRNKKTLKEIEL